MHPEPSPESPEARLSALERARAEGRRLLSEQQTSLKVIKRTLIGVYNDGFIHAGNLAYLALLSLFPFFITATALASLFGQSEGGVQVLKAFLQTVPPAVGAVIQGPIEQVVQARTGPLLWVGALVGLWTVGSLIETLRDILRRAYGVQSERPFWENRLGSIGMIILAVLLMMLSFSATVLLTGAQEIIQRALPQFGPQTGLQFGDVLGQLALARLVPALGLFTALYLLFYFLTPRAYRTRAFPKWPGAVFTTLWWLGVTALLPIALGSVLSYDLTYGSMAGVMVALFFFFLVGLGLVIGAELNAALAEPEKARFAAQIVPDGE
jgi:membrane protein